MRNYRCFTSTNGGINGSDQSILFFRPSGNSCFIYKKGIYLNNKENISNTLRIGNILISAAAFPAINGKVAFIETVTIDGQRPGQPGGVQPPLRNKF